MAKARLLQVLAVLLIAAAVVPAGAVLSQEPPATPPDTPPDATAAAEDLSEAARLILESLTSPPPAAPQVENVSAEDIPNDNGTALGVSFDWLGEPPADATISIELRPDPAILKEFELSPAEQATLDSARDKLKTELGTLVSELDSAAAELAISDEARTVAKNAISVSKDYAGLAALEKTYWSQKVALDRLQSRIDDCTDRFAMRGGRKLLEKQRKYEYLAAALDGEWLPTDVGGVPAAEVGTRAGMPVLYGRTPQSPEQPWLLVANLAAPIPEALAAQMAELHSSYAEDLPPGQSYPLVKGSTYGVRVVVDGAADSVPFYADAGQVTPKEALFKKTLTAHFCMATLYALIILTAIMLARRNPNLFIRRIAGLEAVDEAIGRATEMGKPVLYLNGMEALSELSTLSAINILGRVSRRIADYDSELLVPCRDPVVFTVAQEVVKQGYAEQGRPDAFKANNIYFVTDDQFSYTASVCALMIRERPAANFFMGYYYAESLLLAETGASTGAIQIAGTDSPNQLPFFITTCDYTLIGEELYAASAYLSREPLLLGSLKGQDVGKGLMMLLILAQTVLFIAQYFIVKNGGTAALDFLVKMVEPL